MMPLAKQRLIAAFLAALLLTGSLGAASVFAPEPQLEACHQWARLERQVRQGKASAKEARAAFRQLWPQVKMDEVPSPRHGRWQWVFPLPGYGFKQVAKKSYRGQGYSYYDGPKRQGHPGLDIPIRDKDHDGLDERDKKPAPVVSCMDGVVVAAEPRWDASDSDNPDGVYVCILDQEDGRFFMYAGLSRLKVSVGQMVNKGQVIAWAGRSGMECKPDSKTHLHLQVHDFQDGRFYTLNPLHSLRMAKTLPYPLPEPDYGMESSKPKLPAAKGLLLVGTPGARP
jgi:murein DD-endopeptidase MepM/ murein hydrolase activator NlpD